MKTWTTGLPDWEQRIVAGKSLIPGAPLFPTEAEAALEIFRGLKIVDAPHSPTMAQACRPWVFDFVGAIFGAYDAEEGRRLINEFFLLISKKNSKSTIAAGIMITALLRNWRLSAEFIILAPTIEVAKNSADPAMDMVRHDPALSALLRPIPHQRMIQHRTTGATLKIVAADTDVVSGKKAAGILIDELWLFGKMPNAENMLREATGGLASRPEGFTIALSTQSDEPPAGVFKDWLNRFRDIRDGKLVAPRALGLLYEYPQAMIDAEAYKKRENFYIPNPNLGKSVDVQFLDDEYEKAQRRGAKSLPGFYAKHLNVEIGMLLRSDRWSGAEFWARQGGNVTLEIILAQSEVVVAGVDGGGLDDLFALAVIGRHRVTKDWLCWSHAWCHRGVLQRRKSIASLLQDFSDAGELTIVDDELGDVSEIVSVVERIEECGLLGCVAVDPAGLGELVDALAQIDVTSENEKLVGVPQGYAMMNAIKTTERKLANGTFHHSDSDLMAWAVSNLKIEPTATAIRTTKQNAGDQKIDPAMAMFDAAFVMARNPVAKRSYLEDEELLLL